ESEDPERVRSRAGALDRRRVDDEQDDRDEDDRHVRRVENPREHAWSDPLRDHRALVRLGSHTPPPGRGVAGILAAGTPFDQGPVSIAAARGEAHETEAGGRKGGRMAERVCDYVL